MTGHGAILEWKDDKFAHIIELLESAFYKAEAAFYYNSEVGAHLIDLFGANEPTFDEETQQELRFLDQFFVFAFEGAPDDVIRKWAENHSEGLGDTGVQRIKYLQENAANMLHNWQARVSNSSYTLGDVQADILLNPSAELVQILVRLDVLIPGQAPRRVPLASSRQWINFAATRGELNRVISRLQYFQSLLPDIDSDENPQE